MFDRVIIVINLGLSKIFMNFCKLILRSKWYFVNVITELCTNQLKLLHTLFLTKFIGLSIWFVNYTICQFASKFGHSKKDSTKILKFSNANMIKLFLLLFKPSRSLNIKILMISMISVHSMTTWNNNPLY